MITTIYDVVLSGASTKFGFHVGVLRELLDRTDVHVREVSGTSSGAIVAFVHACGRLDEVDIILKDLKITDFMTDNPNTYRGIIGILYRILFGESVFDQSRLIDTIKSIVSEDDFMIAQDKDITCYVHYVVEKTGEEQIIDVMKLDFETALKYVLGSGSIPPMTKAVNVEGRRIVDGGVVHHAATHMHMERLQTGNFITSFARVKKTLIPWKIPEIGFLKFAVLKRFYRVIELLILGTSIKAEREADEIAEDNPLINHDKLFMKRSPKTESGDFYDILDQSELILQGRSVVSDYFND